MQQTDTICALSSAPGRAGVAVIRISGPRAGSLLKRLCGELPAPRTAELRRLTDDRSGEALDTGLVLWFPAPGSFTGEDVAELHVHGGRAVVASVLQALRSSGECRLAEPGEFARRAFENGKIDLTEAEGLADLIEAETEAQHRQAVRQAGGALARLYDGWREEAIAALALVEAAIDFSDEADVAADAVARARAIVERLVASLAAHLADGHRGEILREGFQVVIAGPPNVGKSSLLNALARRDAAIVSAEAGTTRDVIEVRLDLDGLLVIVSDTAGIRAAGGEVEREGIRRTIARGREADLMLWLMDAGSPEPDLPPELAERSAQTLWVLNKIDLFPPLPLPLQAGGEGRGEGQPQVVSQAPAPHPDPLPLVKNEGEREVVAISALTGAGLVELSRRLAEIARERIGSDESPAITQARHRQALEDCVANLQGFLSGEAAHVELRAEDLRRGVQALGRLTGRVDAELVLDQIFSRFCIGK